MDNVLSPGSQSKEMRGEGGRVRSRRKQQQAIEVKVCEGSWSKESGWGGGEAEGKSRKL